MAPKSHQKGLKIAPKSSQRLPGAPKDLPKSPTGRPRSPPKLPTVSPKCPRAAQGASKEPPRTIRVAFWLHFDLKIEVWEPILTQFDPKFVLLTFGCSFSFLLELLLLISKPRRVPLSSVCPLPFYLFSSRTSTSPLSSLFVVLSSLLKCKLVPVITSTSKKGLLSALCSSL